MLPIALTSALSQKEKGVKLGSSGKAGSAASASRRRRRTWSRSRRPDTLRKLGPWERNGSKRVRGRVKPSPAMAVDL